MICKLVEVAVLEEDRLKRYLNFLREMNKKIPAENEVGCYTYHYRLTWNSPEESLKNIKKTNNKTVKIEEAETIPMVALLKKIKRTKKNTRAVRKHLTSTVRYYLCEDSTILLDLRSYMDV